MLHIVDVVLEDLQWLTLIELVQDGGIIWVRGELQGGPLKVCRCASSSEIIFNVGLEGVVVAANGGLSDIIASWEGDL